MALVLALPAAAAAEGLYLYEIPVARVRPLGDALEGTTRIRAFVADPEALARSLGLMPAAIANDHVEIELKAYPELEPREPGRYLAPSFLIDFDRPEVAALLKSLRTHSSGPALLDPLRRFTAQAIPRKTLERGWDVASRVARAGAGDCTEHAVLLTALARATGHPARVVLGLVLSGMGGELQALGHAWAEVHDGERWVPLDATPIGEAPDSTIYVPIALLDDEGPGYALRMGAQIQSTWVRRLEIDAAAASQRSR